MLSRRAAEIHRRNMRFVMIGEKSTRIAQNAMRALCEAEDLTKDNTGMTLTMAINYGGRQELVRALQLAWENRAYGDGSTDLRPYLWNPDMPDVDLLIRTSGEQRLSNYLLWHLAYSELCFLDVLWPEFTATDLYSGIDQFMRRRRRYGA